jgi:hypothetical protein
MHSVSCLIPASNTQHVELGRVKGRRREEELTVKVLCTVRPKQAVLGISVSGSVTDGGPFTLYCGTPSALSGSPSYKWRTGQLHSGAVTETVQTSPVLQRTADISQQAWYTCAIAVNLPTYSEESGRLVVQGGFVVSPFIIALLNNNASSVRATLYHLATAASHYNYID